MERLKKLSMYKRVAINAICVLLIAIFFYIDLIIAGPAVTFTVIYLIPIIFATWFSGKWEGINDAFIILLPRTN